MTPRSIVGLLLVFVASACRADEPLPPAAAAVPRDEPMEPDLASSDLEEAGMKATKPSDLEIVLTRKFSAPRARVFAALTEPEHTAQWMQAGGMKLVASEIDLRAGGKLKHVFQRPNGRKIEVRGAIESVKAPIEYAYVESYDFSPLRVHVTTSLAESKGGTTLTQTMRYASKLERDGDYDGVATSSAEAFDRLEKHLAK